MSEEKVEPNEKQETAKGLPAIYPVDSSTERETEERERMRRKEEQKHHEQTGS